MKANIDFDKCFSFINLQVKPPHGVASPPPGTGIYRAVAISRQTGAGAHLVAERLAGLLNQRITPKSRQWTTFDRNLVEKVLEDHNLPQRLSQYMPEDRVPEMRATINEALGLQPPAWTLVHQTSETILRLADLGNVILIGRGAHIITRKLNYVFCVRLVGSVEKRVELIQQTRELDRKQALRAVTAEDKGHARYLKQHFGAETNDPLMFHLVINTDRISPDAAAHVILEAMAQPQPTTETAKA